MNAQSAENNTMRTIYLDHAATTPLRREVVNAMYPYLIDTYGNPSSLHRVGREAYRALEATRAKVGDLLGVQPREITFTGSGTEANNLALLGVARAYATKGKHILVSQIEHPSVLSSAERLTEDGFDVEYVPVDAYGLVNPENLLARVRKDTALISVMYANNEIGTIQQITEIARLLTERFGNERPFLHTDACQAVGQLPVSPHDLGVDLMTVNGSKMYGPKGTGMLYVRDGVRILPHTVGGHQESGKRAGTENIALIVGFAVALEYALRDEKVSAERLTLLRDYFIGAVRRELPQAVLNGHETERLPGNVHFSIPHIEGESLLLLLDTYGICASTGSACSSQSLVPSHVLRAIGQSDGIIHGSIRFTLGESTTREDLEYTVTALTTCVERLRAMSPLPLSL